MSAPKPDQIRACGYTRVSTGAQAEKGVSLDAQEKLLREYIEGKGWTLTEIYVEKGISGKQASNRPELQRLLASVADVDRVVVPKVNRLGRNAKDLHDIYGIF